MIWVYILSLVVRNFNLLFLLLKLHWHLIILILFLQILYLLLSYYIVRCASFAFFHFKTRFLMFKLTSKFSFFIQFFIKNRNISNVFPIIRTYLIHSDNCLVELRYSLAIIDLFLGIQVDCSVVYSQLILSEEGYSCLLQV